MSRLRSALFGVALALGVIAAPHAAKASGCGALPYTFVDNVSYITAATTNANNAFLLSCAQNQTTTAAQITPTSIAQATFGGTSPYTFAYGLAVNGPLNLTNAQLSGTLTFPTNAIVVGASGTQTLGILNFGTPTTAGTAQLVTSTNQTVNGVVATCLGEYEYPPGSIFSVDCAGDLGLPGYVAAAAGKFTGNVTAGSANVNGALITTGAANINGLALGVGSTNSYITPPSGYPLAISDPTGTYIRELFPAAGGIIVQNGTVQLVSVTASRCLATDANSNIVATTSPCLQAYSASGSVVTAHTVVGSCTFATSANSCVVSFSGAAQFTSGSTFACQLGGSTSGGYNVYAVYQQSAGGFGIYNTNYNTSTSGNPVTFTQPAIPAPQTVPYSCTGT